MASEPDGTLQDWREIAAAYDWDTLLIGNGLSINVWEPFRYGKLFDHARTSKILTTEDLELFSRTPNFERVLGDLLTAMRVNETLGVDAAPLYESYRNIQLALGHAVREVHVKQGRVPLETRRTIRRELERFEWIFTTSYDLLLYWAIACEGKFKPFFDQFRGNRLQFTPVQAPWKDWKPIYFLHGALHLVTGGTGATWKLRRSETRLDTLLDQFGKPIAGDPQARPLFVTEGSAEDKLAAIERNAYLSHALKRLKKRKLPVVIFGSSLGEQDAHIIDALNQNPDRPVAISMLPAPRSELLAKQAYICDRRLKAKPILFFNTTTHPLGDPALRVPLTRS